MKLIPIFLAGALALSTGCSIKRMAINRVGDALAGGGTVFSSDDDPQLIRDAAPFSLKLMESILAESPRHRGLLLATASGFTQYSYAFVQQEADEIEARDVAAAKALRVRAAKLYLRARNYGLRGLELNHAGFQQALRQDPQWALRKTGPRDVPLLYWTAAAWGAAISLSKNNPDLVADLPKMSAMIDRAVALDEGFDRGALHTFLISYELARPGVRAADAQAAARRHFNRAVELSDGYAAAPYVAFAEGVCVQQQKRAEFEALLKKALAIDVNALPAQRLANLVAQRRAQWLLGKADELFVE